MTSRPATTPPTTPAMPRTSEGRNLLALVRGSSQSGINLGLVPNGLRRRILAVEAEVRQQVVEQIKRAIFTVADNEQYDLGYVKEVRRFTRDVVTALHDEGSPDADTEDGDE